MELSKLFRGLIIVHFVSIVAMVMVVPVDPAYEEISIGIIDIAALIYSLLFFVSLVLLFRFKPSGRTMFTILLIVGIPLSLGMSESSIPTGSLYQTYVWFGGLLEGAMLAILYLTSIKERFQKIEE